MPRPDPRPQDRIPYRHWYTPALLGVLMLILQAGGAPVRAALRYERDAVWAGQIWRLVSAHFVHLGWGHCLLNLAALALCVLLSGRTLTGRAWWIATVTIAFGVGSLLLLAAPSVANYVGFSGVLYGLFVCVLAPQAWRGDRLALILLLLVLARLAWQLAIEPAGEHNRLIGGTVVAQAHLYGAACGLAFVLWQQFRLAMYQPCNDPRAKQAEGQSGRSGQAGQEGEEG